MDGPNDPTMKMISLPSSQTLDLLVSTTFKDQQQFKRLSDESNLLITEYSYDSAGKVTGRLNGNGTSTDYAYDAAGQVTTITHRAPDDSINSRYQFTYDSFGRRLFADL